MTQIIDKTGSAQEVKVELSDYQEAMDRGLTLPQHLNAKYDTDTDKYGTPFEQTLASNGMFLRSDKHTGIKPPSMKDVLSGNVDVGMGPITRPDGNDAQSLTGRLLFPAVVLEMVESELREDNTSYEGAFNSLIATTTNSDSPRMDQPIINLTGPKGSRSQPISQLSEPPAMASITLSEKSSRLPTFSIGLQISSEALQASTLDLVGIAVREQALAERAAVIDEGIVNMVTGDTDLGMSALGAVTAQSFDASISAAGQITRKAWLKYLREDHKKMTITDIITDIDTYLLMEDVIQRDQGDDKTRLNTGVNAVNPGIPNNVNFFLVDPGVVAANTLVGLDRSKAIRKATYTGATYNAIEEFVLKKSTALRIDYSLGYFRLIDQAWKQMTLTV